MTESIGSSMRVDKHHRHHRLRGLNESVTFTCLVLIAVCLLGACDASRQEADVPSPDMTGMERQVHEKIRASRASIGEGASGQAWGRLGMVFHAHGLVDEAVQSYRRAQELSPKEYRWPHLLAKALQTTDPPAARIQAERAIEINAEYAPSYVLLGQLLETEGDPTAAARAYENALSVDGESAAAIFALGRLSLRQGEFEASADLLSRAAELQPYAGAIHAFRARVFRRLGLEENSRLAAEKARGLEPDVVLDDPVLNAMNNQTVSTIGYQGRIKRAEALGEFTEAERLHRRLIELHPEDAGIRFNFANLLTRSGRRDEAEAHYERTLSLDPLFVPALVNLGNGKAEKGLHSEAIALFRRALQIEPGRPSARVSLSNSIAKSGNENEALAILKSVLAKDEQHVPALQGMAQLHGERGQLSEAILFAERALGLQPDSARLHALMADLSARGGRYAEAWEHLHQSQRLGLQIPEEFLEELRLRFPEPDTGR